MEKVRVHEIAKELGVTSKDVVKKALDMGLDLKSASRTVSMEEAEKIVNFMMNGAENDVKSDAPAEVEVIVREKAPEAKKESQIKKESHEEKQTTQQEVAQEVPVVQEELVQKEEKKGPVIMVSLNLFLVMER